MLSLFSVFDRIGQHAFFTSAFFVSTLHCALSSCTFWTFFTSHLPWWSHVVNTLVLQGLNIESKAKPFLCELKLITDTHEKKKTLVFDQTLKCVFRNNNSFVDNWWLRKGHYFLVQLLAWKTCKNIAGTFMTILGKSKGDAAITTGFVGTQNLQEEILPNFSVCRP